VYKAIYLIFSASYHDTKPTAMMSGHPNNLSFRGPCHGGRGQWRECNRQWDGGGGGVGRGDLLILPYGIGHI
jgi:hypothetical protein